MSRILILIGLASVVKICTSAYAGEGSLHRNIFQAAMPQQKAPFEIPDVSRKDVEASKDNSGRLNDETDGKLYIFHMITSITTYTFALMYRGSSQFA